MPERENYLEDGYGVGYPRYGPWMAPAFITAELYPGGDPCSINTAQEAAGNCCQGTCRGTVAAGVCAPRGACGGGCTGGGGQSTGGRRVSNYTQANIMVSDIPNCTFSFVSDTDILLDRYCEISRFRWSSCCCG